MKTRLAAFLFLFFGLAFAASAEAAYGITTADLKIRTGPGVYYRPVAVIPYGSRVDIEQCAPYDAWCLVRWRGIHGWVFSDYLQFAVFRPYRNYDNNYDDYYYYDDYDDDWRRRDGHRHKSRPAPRIKKKFDRVEKKRLKKKKVVRQKFNDDNGGKKKKRLLKAKKKSKQKFAGKQKKGQQSSKNGYARKGGKQQDGENPCRPQWKCQ